MSATYESARRIALGLEKEQEQAAGDDIWSVSLGGGFGLRAEMPFQFFERGFEAPDEQVAQRAALKLYQEEYEADRTVAEDRLRRLKLGLQTNDAAGLHALFSEAPVEEWLSLIFLEGQPLRDELLPLLDDTDAACRAEAAQAFGQGLSRLVDFKDLLEALQEHC